MKQSDLLDRLDVLLGGRVAEKIAFGDVSTGAQNDLRRATDMARQMITQFGMSEQLGLATYEEMRNPMFMGAGMMPRERKKCSESTAQMIDAEVRQILADANARVEQTLLANRNKLEALAKLLLEQEVVDRSGLDLLLSDKVTPVTPGKSSAEIASTPDLRKWNNEN